MNKKMVNKKSEKGIILLLSLLISFIIAFAVSIELLNLRLNKKTFVLNQQKDILFYTIEKNQKWGLTEGKKTNSNCFFKANNNPNYYVEQLKENKISRCIKKIENITLHGITEDLDVFACMHFYRLNLLGSDAQRHQIILQIIISEPEINGIESCQKNNIIPPGQQSWRIVYN